MTKIIHGIKIKKREKQILEESRLEDDTKKINLRKLPEETHQEMIIEFYPNVNPICVLGRIILCIIFLKGKLTKKLSIQI
jgi:hypothetical protein